MSTLLLNRIVVALAGLALTWIGMEILLDPVTFHARNGIELSSSASLLSEVRAPGGLLAVLGVFLLIGAARVEHLRAATLLGAAVYLAYGVSRVLAWSLDGRPHEGLVTATIIEFVFAMALLALAPRSAGNHDLTGRPGSIAPRDQEDSATRAIASSRPMCP